MKPIFSGVVPPDGQLPKAVRARCARKIADKVGQHVDIFIEDHAAVRSQQANNYYWSQVIEPMTWEQTGTRSEAAMKAVHDAMCERFIPKESVKVEFYHHMTGELLTVETDTRRSSKLTGNKFFYFVEDVREFALTWMGVKTEDPDPEYWRKRPAKRQVSRRSAPALLPAHAMEATV